MSAKTWVVTDQAKGHYEQEKTIGPSDAGASENFSIHKRRLQAGLSAGVDVLDVDNGLLRFQVVPTRGMGIWKAWLGDLEIGWRSPVKGPVHPQFVHITDPSGLGWLDGFDELVCRCGLESNGAPDFDERGILKYPLHGKIANRPAHHVEMSVDPEGGSIRVTGVVDETRFHFQKLRLTSTVETRYGQPSLRMIDEVTNLSGNPAEMQLVYHINFGQPLLDPGSKVVAPIESMAPRDRRAAEGISSWESFGNEQSPFAEQVYLAHLLADERDQTHVLLKDAHGMRGASLRFSVKQLPCFTIWKNTPAAADGFVCGLEPGTNFPSPRTFEKQQGRVVALGPGEKARFEVEMEIHGDAAGVAKAEKAVLSLQGNRRPRIFNSVQPDWSKA